MVLALSLAGCATRPPELPKDQITGIEITPAQADETTGQDIKRMTITERDVDDMLRMAWSKETFVLMRKSALPQQELKLWLFMQGVVANAGGACDHHALRAISPGGAPTEQWDIDSCGNRASFSLSLLDGQIKTTKLPP